MAPTGFVKNIIRFSSAIVLMGMLLLSWLLTPASAQEERSLKVSTYDWDPYIYSDNFNGIEIWTGLDLELVKKVLEHTKINYSISEAKPWPEVMEDLAAGRQDIAIGGFITKEREQYAYFSVPLRSEDTVMYVRRGEFSAFEFETIDGLAKLLKKKGMKLGLVSGWSYSQGIDDYLAQMEDRSLVIWVEEESDLVPLLLDGEIDAYFSGLIAGQTLLWRGGFQDRIEHCAGVISSNPVHVMFSKETTTPEFVENFNKSLKELMELGEPDRISRQYLLPILLAITLETQWFLVIDIIGTVAFSLSGIFLGYKEKYSLFGTLVLASLPAMGGGILRDVIVGRDPIGVLRSPVYLIAVVSVVLLSWVFVRVQSWRSRRLKSGRVRERGRLSRSASRFFETHFVQTFDALGLATFTITGVVVAIETQCQPLWLWGPILAMLTGAGGGILRDIVRSTAEIGTLKGGFYAEVPLLWGFLLSCYLMWATRELDPDKIFQIVIVIICGAFFTRVIAMYLRSKRESSSLMK